MKGHLGAYAWSPDGKKLLLTIRADDDADKDAKEDKKTRGREAEADRHRPLPLQAGHPGISDSGTNRALLYLYDVDTQKLDKLTNDSTHDEGNAVWSPDGSKIAYVSNHDPEWDRTINTDVFVVNAAAELRAEEAHRLQGPKTAAGWPGVPTASGSPTRRAAIRNSRSTTRASSRLCGADGTAQRILTAKLDRSVSTPRFLH